MKVTMFVFEGRITRNIIYGFTKPVVITMYLWCLYSVLLLVINSKQPNTNEAYLYKKTETDRRFLYEMMR